MVEVTKEEYEDIRRRVTEGKLVNHAKKVLEESQETPPERFVTVDALMKRLTGGAS